MNAAQSPTAQPKAESIWNEIRCVWLTSFWGWSPETWGTVGFADFGRRENVVRQTTDPFIMVVYVTKQTPRDAGHLRGKVAGFYVVSHQKGHRDNFTDATHHGRNPEKWVPSLKAIRAFSFLPEYRLSIDQLDPTVGQRGQAVARYGEELKSDKIDILREIPFVEVPVYGNSFLGTGNITLPAGSSIGVRAGPVNRSGYTVPGEPIDTPKELYILHLSGDSTSYLGEPSNGRHIFKIGLSISPQLRAETFRKMMPKGAYEWSLYRSTRKDNDEPYPSFEAAEAGERAMKNYLGAMGQHLNGEFYAATHSQLMEAWRLGREAALSHSTKLS